MDNKKINLLEDLLGDYFRAGNENLFSCPFCNHHKKKLSINISNGCWKCWICDKAGKNLYYLFRKFGNPQQKLKWQEISGVFDHSDKDEDIFAEEVEEQIKINLPDEFISLTDKKITPASSQPRQYLKQRGLSHLDILWWKIGYCLSGEYKDRIIIPSFNLEGELDYFIARSYTDDWMKYKNPPLSKGRFIFNELFLDWEKDITITEGVFDAIVAGNSIPLLGSTLREGSYIFNKIIEKCSRVFIALDPDVEAKENKIISLLLTYGVEVCKIPVAPYGDVGSMSKKEFEIRKMNAIVADCDYKFDRLMSSI